MQINEIKQLIDLMCASTLTELELEQNGTRIRLGRNASGAPSGFSFSAAPAVEASVPVAIPAPAVEVAAPVGEAEVKEETAKGPKEIKAPMVGTFHCLPNKKVEAGTKLKAGEMCCIIEAMKLMNEISITEAGEIVSIEVNEGDMVEYGQVLFTYK